MSVLMNEVETACKLLELVLSLNENGTKIVSDGDGWLIIDIFNDDIIGRGETLQEAINSAC